MKIYFVLTLVFVIGFSVVQIPEGYSLTNRNNSFSYYEKNCDNDSCVITTCDDGKSCHTSGSRNSVDNDTFNQLPGQKSIDDRALDIMKMWKNILNFDN